MPDLEDFDSDHLTGELHDASELFRELMIACQFNIPSNRFLDESMVKLLEARNLALDAIRNQKDEDLAHANQLSLELGIDDPGALRFPSWPHIPPTD